MPYGDIVWSESPEYKAYVRHTASNAELTVSLGYASVSESERDGIFQALMDYIDASPDFHVPNGGTKATYAFRPVTLTGE